MLTRESSRLGDKVIKVVIERRRAGQGRGECGADLSYQILCCQGVRDNVGELPPYLKPHVLFL
jgi:hypothetical protein